MSVVLLVACLAAVLGVISAVRLPSEAVGTRRWWALAHGALLLVGGALALQLVLTEAPSGLAEELAARAGNGSGPDVGLTVQTAALLVAVTVAAATSGASTTAAVLDLSRRSEHLLHPTTAELESVDPERASALHGGLWIGFLERAGVVVVLLLGWPLGLTVIAAIKALGRFSELARVDAAERFILGTFASFLWAGAWAGVGVLALHGAA